MLLGGGFWEEQDNKNVVISKSFDLAIEALACELDTLIANVYDDVRLSKMTGLA